ncbi:hypothetical protein J5N97_029249 [Dioscorea zingiberensis]|uniref:Uncharacterized protein n=1 Tax=Dioscorea zingiberensis TaxID=325984 RepID=A0A9D5H5R3_9LILI|nr:hypothetical protein J5N97_029249 [Dioscorea zingiberensis]
MAAEAFKEGSASLNDVGDAAEKTMAASGVFDLEWLDYMEGYYYENLAQGLLVDPPLLTGLDDADFSADVSLWSHSSARDFC